MHWAIAHKNGIYVGVTLPGVFYYPQVMVTPFFKKL